MLLPYSELLSDSPDQQTCQAHRMPSPGLVLMGKLFLSVHTDSHMLIPDSGEQTLSIPDSMP